MQHNDDDSRPKVGVGVVVLKNGKVVIGKRKGAWRGRMGMVRGSFGIYGIV